MFLLHITFKVKQLSQDRLQHLQTRQEQLLCFWIIILQKRFHIENDIRLFANNSIYDVIHLQDIGFIAYCLKIR